MKYLEIVYQSNRKKTFNILENLEKHQKHNANVSLEIFKFFKNFLPKPLNEDLYLVLQNQQNALSQKV